MIKQGYQQEGARFFFKGLGPTMSRTFIVNAVTLPLFDKINENYVQQYV